jgi:hypothetical protein
MLRPASRERLPPTAGAPAKSVASAPANTARVSRRRCRARALIKYVRFDPECPECYDRRQEGSVGQESIADITDSSGSKVSQTLRL